MTTTSTHETEIIADTSVPLVRITREFGAPPDKVFRARAGPDLVVALARAPPPRDNGSMRDDCRPGGSTATCTSSGGPEYWFYQLPRGAGRS